MTFAWPMLLWLLALPLALLVWELTRRRRAAANTHPKILHAEASASALKLTPFTASAEGAARRRSPPRVWLGVGLAFAVVAIARPQWGRIEEPVFDQSREILLAIDLSRSMLAEDVRPSRLARAKLLIQSLLEKLAGERVGLVVFSGTSFLQSPLSADYEILREFLPSLNPDFLPEGGSNYGSLLTTSLQAFTSSASADRFVIILSDGEATDEEWRAKIEPLKAKSIRVLGLGVGTAGGAMIPDGGGGFVKDERGAVVLSKLESGTLQELARATGGVYRDASGWVDIAALVKDTIDAGRKGQFIEKNTIRLVERFQWPLAFALWCLLISFYYEFPVRPRIRDLKPTGNRIPDTGKLANAATTAAALLLLLTVGLAFPAAGFAAAALDPRSKAAQAANATPSLSVAPTGDTAAVVPEPTVLAKIVGRLASAEKRTARDWAEFAGETVAWGKRVQSAKMPVPEGPVRDALGAVSLGSKLDAKTADWPKLREELEALLQKPDEDKQQQQQDKNQQQDQEQKDQQEQQQQQDQSKQDQKSSGKPEDQKKDGEKNSQQSDQQQQQQPEAPKEPGESAFGDMKEKSEPPPPPQQPPGDTQKVGGEQKEKPSEPIDPSLALPLQKLEQIRNQDSPAQLFQLMEGDRKQQKKSGKDW